MISEVIRDRAVFELLASSSGARYNRVADRLSLIAGFTATLQDGSLSPEDLRTWLVERWRVVLRSGERRREEFELALGLPALKHVADAWVEPLLLSIATSNAASAVWLANLARQVLKDRPSDQRTDLWRGVRGPSLDLRVDEETRSVWVDPEPHARSLATNSA